MPCYTNNYTCIPCIPKTHVYPILRTLTHVGTQGYLRAATVRLTLALPAPCILHAIHPARCCSLLLDYDPEDYAEDYNPGGDEDAIPYTLYPIPYTL
jgi:hypothetical protein